MRALARAGPVLVLSRNMRSRSTRNTQDRDGPLGPFQQNLRTHLGVLSWLHALGGPFLREETGARFASASPVQSVISPTYATNKPPSPLI